MKESQTDASGLEKRLTDSDPVWSLLAKSPLPEPDVWFAARTVARCRNEGLSAESPRFSFRQAWRWAVGGGLGVSLAVIFLAAQLQPAPDPDKQQDVQDAFAVVASIDTDTDSSSSSSPTWQDSSR